ncbi:MAG: ABC transporter substrate-binding protein [Xanthobacteraceae bacterium]
MKRREFIAGLGGAAAMPLAARAQQPQRTRRLGVLMNLVADDHETQARVGAFLQGLQEFGWGVGRNIRIDYRWGAGDADRIRQYAAELVALDPDVILTSGSTALAPLLQVSRKVPIVFAQVPDPVGASFVNSLAQPGGNATGFLTYEYGMSGKWLELLKEIAPSVIRVPKYPFEPLRCPLLSLEASMRRREFVLLITAAAILPREARGALSR